MFADWLLCASLCANPWEKATGQPTLSRPSWSIRFAWGQPLNRGFTKGICASKVYHLDFILINPKTLKCYSFLFVSRYFPEGSTSDEWYFNFMTERSVLSRCLHGLLKTLQGAPSNACHIYIHIFLPNSLGTVVRLFFPISEKKQGWLIRIPDKAPAETLTTTLFAFCFGLVADGQRKFLSKFLVCPECLDALKFILLLLLIIITFVE